MTNDFRALRSSRPRVQPLHSSSIAMERPASKAISKRPQRPKQEGFTLMELMVVVGIVAVVVGLALPSMSQQLADQKTNQCALDIVAAARLGRSASTAYGRAHLFRWDPALAGGQGAIEIYRGINNGCNTNNWATITAAGCGGNVNCIDSVYPTEFQSGDSIYRITETGVLGAGGDVCFEPNGTVRWRPGQAGFFNSTSLAVGGGNANGGFVFNVQRELGVAVGVARQVLVPLGGDARKIR